MKSSHSASKVAPLVISRGTIVIALVVLAVAGLGFAGGMSYQKYKTNSSTNLTSNNVTGGPGGIGQTGQMSGQATFGTVTAINSTTITIEDQRQNKTTTYSISSSVKVTNDGASSSASAIAVGDRVMIQVDGTAVSAIDVNPSMPSGRSNSGPATPTGAITN